MAIRERQETLTPRQLDVLRLGTLSNGEIAQRLGIEACTVREHWRWIYHKLGIAGAHDKRLPALKKAERLGLIDWHTLPIARWGSGVYIRGGVK